MKRVSYLLKSSQVLYTIYFYIVSALLKLIGIFLGIDEKLILFNSFGGKKYDDSPKAIYEKILTDIRFNGFKLVWALHEPQKFEIPGRAILVKTDSLQYFITAMKAKVWITNSSIERGLDFKKRQTICFNTWHGTPIKVMGYDIKKNNQSFRSKIIVRADVILAQGQHDIDIYSHAFHLPISKFLLSGYPRNDALVGYSQETLNKIRKEFGIADDKTVVLYAPTFREYNKGVNNEVILNVPINLQYWQEMLGDKFVVLFRAHYEVAKHMDLMGFPMFIDVSSYPNLNELMILADALISDYSSIFFDFSVMHKPMYCFAYDYEEYIKNRGMYLNIKEELPCVIHTDEKALINELLKFTEEKEKLVQGVIRFQQKYVNEYGAASEKCCDALAKLLNIE